MEYGKSNPSRTYIPANSISQPSTHAQTSANTLTHNNYSTSTSK